MLAVSQTTVTPADSIRGLILSMRIIVKVLYLIAKASPIAASTTVKTYPNQT
jgi:hypothetical protein